MVETGLTLIYVHECDRVGSLIVIHSMNAETEHLSPAEVAPVERRSEWLAGGRMILDAAGLIVDLDEAFAAWLGVDRHSVLGLPFAEWSREVFPEVAGPLAEMLDGGETFQSRRFSEGLHWYELEVVRHGGGVVVRLNSALPPRNEIEESSWDEHHWSQESQREMLSRLVAAEAQLQKLGDHWPGVIFSQRADFSFQFVSARIEDLTGYSVQDWKRDPQLFWNVVHDGDARELQARIQGAARGRTSLTSTYRIRHARTGRIAYILEHRQVTVTRSGLVLGYEGAWLDVTRQTIAENRLSSAAWKETLAVVTMGLAHDFSNIMAGILSLSESFQMQFRKDDPAQEGLKLIQRNSVLANQLVQRIIKLHHGKAGEKRYHDFNQVVGEILELIQKITPRRIQVRLELHPTTAPVYLDPVEFQQVFINLALNAIDAMPNSGTLTFQTSIHEVAPALAHLHGKFPRLPCVCLSVQDTGSGIPERYRNAIFDPFFTTKAMNKGSGLGLYNSQLFCEKHHGAISVESEENRGTTFRVWLPQADFHEDEAERVMSRVHRQTLLLVGMPGEVLDRAASFLREQQFYVVTARAREEVGEIASSAEYQLSAVVIQTTLSAEERGLILRDLQNLKPPVKVLLQLVGCHEDEISYSAIQEVAGVLPSNVPPRAMMAALRKALE